MLGSLAVVTLGFIPIGLTISELLDQRSFLQLSLIIFTCLGTILALVKGIGSLFPAVVVNVSIFNHLGLMALVVSATLTGIVLGLALVPTDDKLKEDKSQILPYELLGGICISLFGYLALQGLSNIVSIKLLPVFAGLLAGFLSIFSELSNFLGLEQKQATRLVCFLALTGVTIGIVGNRLLSQGGNPG